MPVCGACEEFIGLLDWRICKRSAAIERERNEWRNHGAVDSEAWRLVNIAEGSRTCACMQRATKKKDQGEEGRRGHRRYGEKQREREGGTHRRRQQIANERMGAFETRCKVPPGLVVHFAVKLSSRSGRHGTARHGTARVRHIATAAAVVSSPTKFVALSANFQTHRPKLTAVRITLFPSGNKGDSTQMKDLAIAE